MLINRAKPILLVLILLLLVACGGETGESQPTEAPAQPATESPADTAEPPAEPTEEPAAPTDVPAPTAEPTPEPTAVPRVRLGLLRFSDSATTRSGAYRLQMPEATAPPAGSHYELWLVGDDGATLNVGALAITDGGIDQAGEVEENLIGTYSSAIISVQPDGETSSTPDVIAFEAVVPAEALVHVRHVVFEFSGNPDGQGFVLGAESQSVLAGDHALLLQEALAANDLDEAKQHAEHVINILEGESSEAFGDYTGDDVAQNPGDGLGVRNYLAGAQQHAQLAADSAGATDEVKLHSGHVIISAANTVVWLDEAVDEAVHVISADTVAEAQPFADTLAQLVADMLAGRDEDGDGAVAPVAGEGGLATAYQHGQLMGAFEVFAPISETAAEEAPAEEAPAEEAPADEPATAEVFIDMLNFAFSEQVLTIPVGTTVTWRNLDTVQHSATADDGSFDTGLFNGGEEASITFDTVGEFRYYCLLHGGPDGTGMSAVIVVTDGETSDVLPVEESPVEIEIFVDMLNFAFSEQTLTIEVGTTVTWRNRDTVRHSATADDGSFDTGLFGGGEEASITFDTVGEFRYYCLLHGGPGGTGMSAVIIVTES